MAEEAIASSAIADHPTAAHPILAYEAELRAAMLMSNVEALDRLIDDDLVFTALDGNIVGKQADLALHRSGRLHILRLDPSDQQILPCGSVVVVSVRMEAEATFDGAVMEGPLRYTRVWGDRPGGWRVVAGHMSAVQG